MYLRTIPKVAFALRNEKLTISGARDRQRMSLPQVVLLHVIAKRSEAHTQKVRRPHLDPSGLFEGFGNVAPFDLLDVRLEVKACFGQRLGGRRGGPRGVAPDAGRLSGRIAGVASRATARSMAFSSSRMFPGQSC